MSCIRCGSTCTTDDGVCVDCRSREEKKHQEEIEKWKKEGEELQQKAWKAEKLCFTVSLLTLCFSAFIIVYNIYELYWLIGWFYIAMFASILISNRMSGKSNEYSVQYWNMSDNER